MVFGKVFFAAVLATGSLHAFGIGVGAGVGIVPPLNTNRAEVLEFFAENVYGVRPDLSGFKPTCEVVESVSDAALKAKRLTVKLNVMTPVGERTFPVYAYVPASRKRVPVFVYISFNDPLKFDPKDGGPTLRWDVKDILAAGYATAAFCYENVFRDTNDEFKGAKRPENGWGAISCWALAASRVMDWLEGEDWADASKVAVVGHSRLGKTALWTAANDTRFAMCVPNCSGCLGARVSTAWTGETFEQITTKFPHWFAPKCRQFVGKDKDLPFGQHWLLAMVAPRLLVIGSAEDDWWACPGGELLGWTLSSEAWKDASRTRYHIRKGGHDLRPEDWAFYLDFVKSHGW